MSGEDKYIVDLQRFQLGETELEYVLDEGFFQAQEGVILGGNVRANIRVEVRKNGYMLVLHAEGDVIVTCDRCLDEMTLPIDVEDELQVKIGVGENDESTIWLQEGEERVDMGWLLYETIVINLPMIHRHQDGECNPHMQELLQAHICQMEDPEEDNSLV